MDGYYLVTLEYSEDMYHEFSYSISLEFDESKSLWRLKSDRKISGGKRLSWKRGKKTEDPRTVAIELLYKSYDRCVLLFDVISDNGPFNILMSDITENPNKREEIKENSNNERAEIREKESNYDLVWRGWGYNYSDKFYKSKSSYSKYNSIDYDENGEIQTISGKELIFLYNNATSNEEKVDLEKIWKP